MEFGWEIESDEIMRSGICFCFFVFCFLFFLFPGNK